MFSVRPTSRVHLIEESSSDLDTAVLHLYSREDFVVIWRSINNTELSTDINAFTASVLLKEIVSRISFQLKKITEFTAPLRTCNRRPSPVSLELLCWKVSAAVYCEALKTGSTADSSFF